MSWPCGRRNGAGPRTSSTRLTAGADGKRRVQRLAGDEAFRFYPRLSAEGGSVEQRHRGTVPLEELFRLYVGTI
jgi:hypothetical protein